MTAPARPQIAESLEAQLLGEINRWRFEQSEFQTLNSLPLLAASTAT